MKTLLKYFSTLITVAALTASLQAADDQKDPQKKPEPKPGVMHFRGTVVSVDKTAKTVTVKGQKADRTFKITDQTKIRKDGHAATLDDVKSGEEVGGQLKKNDDGKLEALSLRIGPKPEGQPKKKKQQ